MSNMQIYGIEKFDIRYHILGNPKMILEKMLFLPFDRLRLFSKCIYEILLKFYENKEVADGIWSEIQICKQIHNLRSQQWGLKLNFERF